MAVGCDVAVASDRHSYIHALGDACLVVDERLSVVASNAAAEHLYVCAHGSMRGLRLTDLSTIEDASALRAKLGSLNGAPRSFTINQVRGDGSTFLADFSAKPYHGPDGIGSVLVVRERKALGDPADMWLRSELLDLSPDGIYAYTPDGALVYANRAARDLWGGATLDDLRDRGPWAWVPIGDQDRLAHRLNVLFDKGVNFYESCRPACLRSEAHCEISERVVQTTRGKLVVASVRDISNRRIAEEEVRYLAYHDPLTGLANRMLFNQEIAHAISAAERHEDIVGIVYLDLDDFKPINDTHGHAVGDTVLCRVAERLISCIRLTDTAARLGGDEFVVLLPRLRSTADLPEVAEKIGRAIAQPIYVGPAMVTVTCSMGMALHHHGETIDTMLKRADEEMYRSRQTGVPGWMSSAS